MEKAKSYQEQPVMAVPDRPMDNQFVATAVSKIKFEKEVSVLLNRKQHNLRRGIIVLDVEFPNVYIAFAAPQLSPAPIVFAVKINFDNYDLEPLSIQFVNPFTAEPVFVDQVKSPFLRIIKGVEGKADNHQQLIQAQEDRIPFLCLPGVREYHKHPFHSGDSWFLHRKVGGEGTLGFLVEKLYQYGIESLNAYQVQINLSFLASNAQLNLGVNLQNLQE